MRISHLGASDRFIEAANFLNVQVELSRHHGAQNGGVHTMPHPPFIRKEDREAIRVITAAAGIARETLPDRLSETDLDELFAPFLDRLQPYVVRYGSH